MKETRNCFFVKWRLLIQAAFFALTNGYVQGYLQGRIYQGQSKALCVPGLNCYSCPGARFACPMGALQAVLSSGEYRLSLYALGFLGAFGLFLGRFVCGWLCPFGLVQELLHRIPLMKKRKNLPGHRYLIWLKYGILALFVVILPMTVTNIVGMGDPWFCKYICPSGTLFAGIPMVSLNESLREAAGYLFDWKLLGLLLLLVLSVKFKRPFCKYLCPLGAFYGFFNKVSFYRLQVAEDKCIRCGRCRELCPMDIRTWEDANSMECIRCGECRVGCPTGAITSTMEELLSELKRNRRETAGKERDHAL